MYNGATFTSPKSTAIRSLCPGCLKLEEDLVHGVLNRRSLLSKFFKRLRKFVEFRNQVKNRADTLLNTEHALLGHLGDRRHSTFRPVRPHLEVCDLAHTGSEVLAEWFSAFGTVVSTPNSLDHGIDYCNITEEVGKRAWPKSAFTGVRCREPVAPDCLPSRCELHTEMQANNAPDGIHA